MKNLIIEMVNNEEIKSGLYSALNSGAVVAYSTNWRATPVSEYNSDTLNIKVNPTNKDMEYFDKHIQLLSDTIPADKKEYYKTKLIKMTADKQIKAVTSLSNQYDPIDIIDYILN